MNENISLDYEQTADQQDAFLAGWEDTEIEVEQTADQPEDSFNETENTEQQQTDEAVPKDEISETVAEKADADVDISDVEKSDEAAVEQPQKTQWILKHMGEEKTLSVDDITPELLQKGLDYERIREKYEEAKPVMSMFSDFANRAGMNVNDYIKHIRAEAKKATGMSDEEAKRTVALEDREAAVNAKEEAEKEKKENAENESNAKKLKIDADLSDFQKAFPEIYEKAKGNPKEIPQCVWEDVNKGLSLTAAYAKFSVARAKEETAEAERRAAAQIQNNKNADRATGSMKSAGEETKNKDPFMAGFSA